MSLKTSVFTSWKIHRLSTQERTLLFLYRPSALSVRERTMSPCAGEYSVSLCQKRRVPTVKKTMSPLAGVYRV